jgi:hypothetical protein
LYVCHAAQNYLIVRISVVIVLNIPNLSIVVKTDDPVRVREREQIKEFICKPAYLLKKYSGVEASAHTVAL